jgi:hypothetical protein
MCLHTAFSQALIDHVDFSGFAPTRLDQYKGTCYAYATTYTALTIKFNLLKKAQTRQEVNDNAFSAAFTASMVRKQRSFLAKLFSFWSCSSGGNIEKAAKIIQDKGAIFNNEHNGCCFIPSDKQIEGAASYKIKNFNVVLKIEDKRDPEAIKTQFKEFLRQNIPIVCAIHQTNMLRGNIQLDLVLPAGGDPEINDNSYKNSNHAICVLGFDDHHNGGSFLVKNNYSSFGVNGRAWINYADFLKYLSYALVLGDFETSPSN